MGCQSRNLEARAYLVVFGENCFCHNKYIDILRKGTPQLESIYIVRFFVKNCTFEKSPTNVSQIFYFDKVVKYFWTKN